MGTEGRVEIKPITSCPNCGAALKEAKCNYCGATIMDVANLEVGKETYIRVRFMNKLIVTKAITNAMNIEAICEGEYYDRAKLAPYYLVNIEMEMVPAQNGTLYTIYKEEKESD